MNCKITRFEPTPEQKRYVDTTFLMSRIQKEGKLESKMVKVDEGYKRMYYPKK